MVISSFSANPLNGSILFHMHSVVFTDVNHSLSHTTGTPQFLTKYVYTMLQYAGNLCGANFPYCALGMHSYVSLVHLTMVP